MSLLTTYWLCRTPGAQAEGPFSFGHIRKLHEGGQITTDAMVCRKGEEDWISLEAELEAMTFDQQPAFALAGGQQSRHYSFEAAMQRRDDEQAERFNKAIVWVTVALCLLGAVPVLGFLVFVVYGFWAFVAMILCILQMSRGHVGRGIANLIGVILIGPLMILLLQFISLAIFGSAAQAMQ